MKKFIAILIAAYAMITGQAKADKVFISNCFGCTDKESLDEITRYVINKDNESMYRLINTGKCTVVNGSANVADRGFVTSQIDYHGQTLFVASECVR